MQLEENTSVLRNFDRLSGKHSCLGCAVHKWSTIHLWFYLYYWTGEHQHSHKMVSHALHYNRISELWGFVLHGSPCPNYYSTFSLRCCIRTILDSILSRLGLFSVVLTDLPSIREALPGCQAFSPQFVINRTYLYSRKESILSSYHNSVIIQSNNSPGPVVYDSIGISYASILACNDIPWANYGDSMERRVSKITGRPEIYITSVLRVLVKSSTSRFTMSLVSVKEGERVEGVRGQTGLGIWKSMYLLIDDKCSINHTNGGSLSCPIFIHTIRQNVIQLYIPPFRQISQRKKNLSKKRTQLPSWIFSQYILYNFSPFPLPFWVARARAQQVMHIRYDIFNVRHGIQERLVHRGEVVNITPRTSSDFEAAECKLKLTYQLWLILIASVMFSTEYVLTRKISSI